MKNLLKSIGWAVLIVGLALSLAFGFNGSGLCEGRASRHKSSNLAQMMIEVQMFNKPLMPCFCKTLVMGSCFYSTQNLVK